MTTTLSNAIINAQSVTQIAERLADAPLKMVPTAAKRAN